MNEVKKISPADRARLFKQTTRQNMQIINSKSGTVSTVHRIELPKARLLSRIWVEITGILTATHATETVYVPHADSPFNFLEKVTLDLNNGFKPMELSGEALWLYNIFNRGAVPMALKTSGRGSVVQPLVCSSGGTANSIRMLFELPVTLDQRDPVGLILLNNPETLATVDVLLGAVADLAPVSSGFTFSLATIVINIYGETFSVPALAEALPDLSILKIVHEKTEAVIAGENTFKLPVGLTYRKLGFIYYDATPSRQVDTDITSNIELILNQADYPYRIKPTMLAGLNADQFGGALPDGAYVFDFSSMQGLRNLSGGRDYIDTESLTEFWLRFTAGAVGTIRIFYEAMSKLR